MSSVKVMRGSSSDDETSVCDEEVYHHHHSHHLQALVTHATRLLHHTQDHEGRAGLLHEFLQEFYLHEERLNTLKKEGVLSDTIGQQQPSLVPVSSFMRVYISRGAPSLRHSSRALSPFRSRAGYCPVFSYVVERLGLLQEPPAEAPRDHLAGHLRHIHVIFNGPPTPEDGPLGVLHARLVQRYAECVSRRRYRVRLEDCEPLRLASHVFQWLEESYAAAITELKNERLALSVVKEAHTVLLSMPYKNKEYFQDVIQRAMEFLTTSVNFLPSPPVPTPPVPPQPPQPLIEATGYFFPGEFIKLIGSRVLNQSESPSLILKQYLKIISTITKVFGVPQEENLLPQGHLEAVVGVVRGSGEYDVLRCLQVALRWLKTDSDGEVLRGLCVRICSESIGTVKAVWSREDPEEHLNEEHPILKVTRLVQEVVLESDLNMSPFLEEAVQEACEQVRGAFVRYLQKVARREKDPHTRRFILLKNLLVLGTYEQAEEYLDLHDL